MSWLFIPGRIMDDGAVDDLPPARSAGCRWKSAGRATGMMFIGFVQIQTVKKERLRMSEDIVKYEAGKDLFVAPVTDVRTALMAYQAQKDFIKSVLVDGVDYGTIPGTAKPTLYKPGAEKLNRFFGMSVLLSEIGKTEDWQGITTKGEPFFFYRYKATAERHGIKIAEGIGSCSSWEKKYRYRNLDKTCPNCGKATIRKGSEKFGGGWYCNKKAGGCGANFKDGDKSIEDQPAGQVLNSDPADIVNTIDKMAQKRAIIAATLLACNASEYFTQDVEDYIDGTFVEAPAEPVDKPEPQPKQVKKPAPAVKQSLTLETLKTTIDSAAMDAKAKNAKPNGHRQQVAAALSAYFAQDEDKRHKFTAWVTGHESIKTMPDEYVVALFGWMKPYYNEQSGSYLINAEAKKVIDAWVKEYSGDGTVTDPA